MVYGSAREIYDNLNLFRRFPGSHHKFQFDTTEVYTKEPIFYQSMKRIPYIYKQDYFVILQSIISTSPLRKFETEFSLATITAYLKMKELSLPALNEMVPYCAVSAALLQTGIQDIQHKFNDYLENPLLQLEFKKHTFEELFVQWKQINPLFEMESIHDSLQDLLKKFIARNPIRDNEDVFKRVFAWSQLVVLQLDIFVRDCETLFKPKPSTKPIVRIFDDKPNKLIMAYELLDAMKQAQMDVSKLEEEVLEMPELSTFTYQQVASRISPQDMRTIEFVITPITVAKYAATPIPTINKGEYCILASDFLFNLLGNMITAKKMFQRIEPSQLNVIREFFNFVDNHFDFTYGIQFIDLELVEMINSELDTFHRMLTISSKGPSDIRDRQQEGFTKTDLSNELKHLKLDLIFPEICELSEFYFVHLTKTLKIEKLSTSDVYGIVEHLQIDCLARRFPKLAEFIHSQLVCSRIFGYQCQKCFQPKEPKVAGVEAVEIESKKELTIDDSAETMKRKITLEFANKVKETLAQLSDLKNEKPKKSKKQKPSQQLVPEKVKSNPDPCQKCFRTSEYHNKTKEDFRLEKIETKRLRKALKESQKESEEKSQNIAEKDQEMLLLKEHVESIQREFLKYKSDMNNVNNETIRLQTTQLLEHQQALAQKSLEVIEQKDEILHLKAQNQSQQTVIAQQEKSIKSLKEKSQQLEEKRSITNNTQRLLEETEIIHKILVDTLKAQEIFESESPLNKITVMTSRICETSQDPETKSIAKREFRYFARQIEGYRRSLKKRINSMKNETIRSDDIPELREFPTFSDEFVKAYKDTLKKDAPLICAPLLKLPETIKSDELDDKECLVCLEDMVKNQDTVKCSTCKRQYHTTCVQKWFKIKRICPTCNAGLLDENEFPALS